MDDSEQSPSDWREQRRLRAWELHQQGWSQPQIAKALSVTQGAVSQWMRRVREGGVDALAHRKAPGRRAALTEAQFATLSTLLAPGAEAYGFRGDRWTTQRVADVLNQIFGVSYHPAHVSRLLRKYSPNWRDKKEADAPKEDSTSAQQ